MADQTPNESLTSSWLLEAAAFFENDANISQKWQGVWKYQEINDLLIFLLKNIDPFSKETELKKIIPLIKQFLENGGKLESVVPHITKELLEEVETNRQNSEFLRKRTKQEISVWLEQQKKQAKKVVLAKKLAETAVQRLSQSPFSGNEIKDISKQIVPFFSPEEEILLAWAKIDNVPDSIEKKSEEVKLSRRLQEKWEETIDQTVTQLKQEGKQLTFEQISFLKINRPSDKDLIEISQSVLVKAEAPVSETRIDEAINKVVNSLSPTLTKEQAESLVQTILPTLTLELPELDLPKNLTQLSEEQFKEVQEQMERAVVHSLALNSSEIAENIPLSPQETRKIIISFFPQTLQEVSQILPLLSLSFPEKQTLGSSLDEKEPLPVIAENARTTPQTADQPRLFASVQWRLSHADPRQLQTDSLSYIDKLKLEFSQQGINKQNINRILSDQPLRQALLLAVQGITVADIEQTIDVCKQKGLPLNSLAITELEKAKRNLDGFLKTIPPELKESVAKWQKQRIQARERGNALPVRLPESRSFVQILEAAKFNPRFNIFTRLDNFTRKIFGEKAILHQNTFVFINRLSFFRQNITNSIKTWFFKTGLGKTIKSGFEKIGLKALQSVWNSVKIGTKQFVSKAIATVAAKLGLQTVFAALGAFAGPVGILAGIAIGFLAKKIIKGTLSIFTQVPRLFKTLGAAIFGLTQTGFDEKDGKELVYVIAGTIAIIFIFTAFIFGPIGGAFMGSGVGSALPGGMEINPECQKTRHLAEETICKLSQEKEPCNNSFITISTWPQVNNCFLKTNLTGGDTIKKYFFNSINLPGNNGNLQCGSFAMAIQAALGKPLIPVNSSREWLNPTNVPSYYELIKTGNPKLSPGDLVVWQGSADGHIAIVINNLDQEGKVVVSEANGQTGRIALVAYPYISLGGQDGSPDGLLRPK